jgi:hypothetical protein
MRELKDERRPGESSPFSFKVGLLPQLPAIMRRSPLAGQEASCDRLVCCCGAVRIRT